MPNKPSRPEELLRELAARPRATGSAALREARERCAGELSAIGFVVRDRPFEFSTVPGRLATPLVGIVSAIVVAAACHLGARGSRMLPLAVLAGGMIAMAMIGRWISRRGVLDLRAGRATGVNLAGTIAGDAPRVWLCAHLDTKSQPVPTLVRTAGVMILVVGVVAACVASIMAALQQPPSYGLWVAVTVVTLIGAIPVVSSVVGTQSPGALDNASGVVTVLTAAKELTGVPGVGVLITDAEELGLAGARAWSRDARRTTVLNCDGVDDSGVINVLYSGRRPRRVIDAATDAASAVGVAYRARRMPVGILMDSVAFSDAGWETVSFSRGTVCSLARVHSRRDNLVNLRGTGIAETATFMAATARMLLNESVESDVSPDGVNR